MQYLLIFLPALYAAWFALQRSPQQAFVRIYLPVLLLLPASFRAVTPGLPDPTFAEAMAIAIFAVMLVRGTGPWRFSFNDLMVLAYAGVVGYSEYTNTNYAEAQNLMFAMFASVLLPYAFGKALIEPAGLRVEAARRIVLCVALAVLLSLYEVRMGVNPFISRLGVFFPGQGGWNVTFRYGITAAGRPLRRLHHCGHHHPGGLPAAARTRTDRGSCCPGSGP